MSTTTTTTSVHASSALKKLFNTLLLAGLDHTARSLEMKDPASTQAEVQCVRDEALMVALKQDPEVQSLLRDLQPTQKVSETDAEKKGASLVISPRREGSEQEPKLCPQAVAPVFTAVPSEGQPNNLSVAWYFAYGSNMSAEQAKVRLGKHYGRELLHLDGHRLIFNKSSVQPGLAYANVIKTPSSISDGGGGDADYTTQVYGVGYQLTADQLLRMDHFEGVHFQQYARERVVCTVGSGPLKGTRVTAFIYFAISTVELPAQGGRASEGSNDDQTILPSAEYLGRLAEGSDILPDDYALWVREHKTSKIRSPRQDMRLRKEL